MSSTTCGIACLITASLLCGCAVDRSIEHWQLGNMLGEYEREIETLAQPREVELVASDSLGRRMDRSHRRLARE